MDYLSITGRSLAVLEFQRHIMEKFYALPSKYYAKGNKEISCSKGAWDKSPVTARRPELIKLIGIRNYTHPDVIKNSPELNYFRYNSGIKFQLQEGWKNLLKEGLFLLIHRMGWDNMGTKKNPQMVEDEVFEEYLEWFVEDLNAEDWGHEPYMYSKEERQDMLGKSSDEDGDGGTYIPSNALPSSDSSYKSPSIEQTKVTSEKLEDTPEKFDEDGNPKVFNLCPGEKSNIDPTDTMR